MGQIREAPYVHKRGNVFYFRMAVPARARHRYGSAPVWRSLNTRDVREANRLVASHVVEWLDRFANVDGEPLIQAEKVIKRAEALKMTEYKDRDELTSAPIRESYTDMVERLAVFKKKRSPTAVDIAALLGEVERPGMTMAQALVRYKELCSDKFNEYSNQRERDKRWRPFVSAANQFMKLMGKVDVFKLKPKDCIVYRDKLLELKKAGEFDLRTARKKIMWLRLIHTKILEIDAPELLPSPWDRITIEGDGTTGGKRKPFKEEEIVLLEKAFAESTASAQTIALNIISSLTGATCKELTHIHRDDIFVGPDEPIPYIAIRPNENRKRVKKNGSRIREVPLIGKALEEMRKFPDGFDEFCHNNGSEELSAKSNPIIKTVAPDKSFYCYRHRLADKLRRSGCGDTLKDAIMGHTTKGMSMHYGEGYELQNKLDALLKAFPEVKH